MEKAMGEDITPEDSVVPIYLLKLSDQQIAERKQWQLENEQRQQEEQAKEAAKISALEKLAKLGLTEEEAKAIIGIS